MNRKTLSVWLDEYFVFFALLALIALFGAVSDHFLSAATLSTVLNQLPSLMLVTVGMTLVMMVGGIDLSVGSLLALSAAIIGVATVVWGVPLPLAVILGVGAATFAGSFSGWLTSYLGLPSFIVTLGMLEAARGLAYMVSKSQTVFIGPRIQDLSLPLGAIGLSPAFLIALAVIFFAHGILKRTVAGRYLIAIGTNERAARISGIETKPYRMATLAVSGFLAGIAGLFNASYLAAADPNAGTGLELSAIAAAVIGGTSLMGGRGSVIGAFIGVLIIAILQSGLAQIGLTEPVKRMITGTVIIVAVLLDRWRAKRRMG
jgi:ribose transport system permease protein